jgi:hypothetical protein
MIQVYELTSWENGGKCTQLGVFPSSEAAISATHPAVITAARLLGALPCPRPGIGAIKMTGLPEYQVAERQIERDGSPRYDADVLHEAAEILLARYGLLVAGDLISGLRNRADALGNLRAKVEKEVEEARVAMMAEGDAEEPGSGYWEAGDL